MEVAGRRDVRVWACPFRLDSAEPSEGWVKTVQEEADVVLRLRCIGAPGWAKNFVGHRGLIACPGG